MSASLVDISGWLYILISGLKINVLLPVSLISKLPFRAKLLITTIIAIIIYYPLAKFSLILENLGINTSNIPISSYKKSSFYTMKTDALDRFGTRLEHRFTKTDIQKMMEKSGLKNIKFNNTMPYWVAVGEKK